MATHTRKSAWNNSGTFKNQDLLWYAKGVGDVSELTVKGPQERLVLVEITH